MINIFIGIYYVVLVIAGLSALLRFSTMDLPGRLICGFIWLGALTEATGRYWSLRYQTNIPVYNVSCLLEFFLVSVYFNFLLSAFRKRHLGILIGLFGAVAGSIYWFLSGSIRYMNASFLFMECLFIMAMVLYALYSIMASDVKSYRSPSLNFHFWVLVILAFYQCGGLSIWGLSTLMGQQRVLVDAGLGYLLIGNNILVYACLSIVFLRYSKMKKLYA